MEEKNVIKNVALNKENVQYVIAVLAFSFGIKLISLVEKAIEKNYNVKADFKEAKIELYH